MVFGRSIAGRLADIPRWVEARDLLLGEEGEIFGLQQQPELALVVRDPESGLAIVVGRPALSAVQAAVDNARGELLVLPEHADWAAQAVPGWTRSRVRLHSLADPERLPPVAAEGEVRFLDPGRISGLAVSAELRGELESAAAYMRIAAAWVGDEPVSFCYAGSETEALWDVSIDTVPAHQRQGWAAKAAAFMIRHMLAKGKQPVWAAVEENPASWRLAEKLGFARVDETVLFAPPHQAPAGS